MMFQKNILSTIIDFSTVLIMTKIFWMFQFSCLLNDDFWPFLCIQVNAEIQNWPFDFNNSKVCKFAQHSLYCIKKVENSDKIILVILNTVNDWSWKRSEHNWTVLQSATDAETFEYVHSCNFRAAQLFFEFELRSFCKVVHNVRKYPKCLSLIFQFWHFPSIFVLLKVTCLVTLFDYKL